MPEIANLLLVKFWISIVVESWPEYLKQENTQFLNWMKYLRSVHCFLEIEYQKKNI